jgi:chitin synthase
MAIHLDVSSARAITDVPDAMAELISQRRRWLNGSTFATIYAIANWYRIFRDAHHSFGRKIMLTVQLFYNILAFIFAWFSLVSSLRSIRIFPHDLH